MKKLQRLKNMRKARLKLTFKIWRKPFIIILLIGLILRGCIGFLGSFGDPVRNIGFINHTGKSVTVMVEYVGKEIPEIFDLNDKNKEELMIFGVGYWDEDELLSRSETIKKISIKTEEKTLVYEQSQILPLLQKNLQTGTNAHNIDIHIE